MLALINAVNTVVFSLELDAMEGKKAISGVPRLIPLYSLASATDITGV